MEIYRSDGDRTAVRQRVADQYRKAPVPMESIFVDTGEFGKTHLLVGGNPGGRPLVLLHGASGNSTAWFGMLGDLEGAFRLYLADIPGQPGLSGSDRPELDGEVMSRWLQLVLDGVGLETVYLGGMSLGGWAAMEFAVAHPEKTAGLAVISPSGIMPPKISFVFRVLPLTFLGKWGQRKLFRLIHGPVPVFPEMLEFARFLSGRFRPMTETPELFTDEELASIRFPLLFIGGEDDVMLDMDGSADRIWNLVSRSRVVLRTGFSHVLPDEGTELAEFFSA